MSFIRKTLLKYTYFRFFTELCPLWCSFLVTIFKRTWVGDEWSVAAMKWSAALDADDIKNWVLLRDSAQVPYLYIKKGSQHGWLLIVWVIRNIIQERLSDYLPCPQPYCPRFQFVFCSFCEETLAQKWNKKWKLACFLGGAAYNLRADNSGARMVLFLKTTINSVQS